MGSAYCRQRSGQRSAKEQPRETSRLIPIADYEYYIIAITNLDLLTPLLSLPRWTVLFTYPIALGTIPLSRL